MRGALRWGWLVVGLVACGDEGRGPGRPPPAGMPWLADQYAVEMTLLESDCFPGGFDPVALPAVATVWQDGARVEWSQETGSADGDFWYLTGALCPRDDGYVLRLAGGRRNTVEGCQVRSTLPAVAVDAKADPCTTDGYMELLFEDDGCGSLRPATESVRARLTYSRACAARSNCDMVMSLRAVPTVRDVRAPETPRFCR